jgi:hypothetical protein
VLKTQQHQHATRSGCGLRRRAFTGDAHIMKHSRLLSTRVSTKSTSHAPSLLSRPAIAQGGPAASIRIFSTATSSVEKQDGTVLPLITEYKRLH